MEKKEADFKSSLGAHKLKESSKGNKILQEQQTQQVRVATSVRGRWVVSELAVISQSAHEGGALLTVEDSACLPACLPAFWIKLVYTILFVVVHRSSVETPKFQTKEKKNKYSGLHSIDSLSALPVLVAAFDPQLITNYLVGISGHCPYTDKWFFPNFVM